MYCDLPFYHFYIDGNAVKPCCINTNTFHSSSDFNDINLVNFRKELLSGRIPESCSGCKNKEDAGVTSYRQYNQEMNSQIKFEHIDGFMISKPYTFDIRLDNICNMKCVMCGPSQSSKWNEDIEIYKKYVDDKVDYKQSRNERLANFEKIGELLKDNAHYVAFYGGEPFQMKSLVKMLKLLTDWNKKNTTILITTNANFTSNNELLNVLSEFDNVYFMISIDGFQKVNEYIRFPSEWETLIRSTKLLQQISLKVKYNLTISALNYCDITNVEKFAQEMGIELVLNELKEPDFLSINSLKSSVIYNTEINDEISHLISSYKFNQKNNNKLKRYLYDLDKKRNTNSKEILKWCWV